MWRLCVPTHLQSRFHPDSFLSVHYKIWVCWNKVGCLCFEVLSQSIWCQIAHNYDKWQLWVTLIMIHEGSWSHWPNTNIFFCQHTICPWASVTSLLILAKVLCCCFVQCAAHNYRSTFKTCDVISIHEELAYYTGLHPCALLHSYVLQGFRLFLKFSNISSTGFHC